MEKWFIPQPLSITLTLSRLELLCTDWHRRFAWSRIIKRSPPGDARTTALLWKQYGQKSSWRAFVQGSMFKRFNILINWLTWLYYKIPDPAVALSEAKSSLKDWDLRLAQVHISSSCQTLPRVLSFLLFPFQLKIERKPGDSAVLAMTQNVTTRLDVRSRKSRYTIVKNVFGHANGFKMTFRMDYSGKWLHVKQLQMNFFDSFGQQRTLPLLNFKL